jgi:hypothetical protein
MDRGIIMTVNQSHVRHGQSEMNGQPVSEIERVTNERCIVE